MNFSPVSALVEVYQPQQLQRVPANVMTYLELCCAGLQVDAKNHLELQDVLLEVEQQIRGVMNGTRDPAAVSLTNLIRALGKSANNKFNLTASEFVSKPQIQLDPTFKPFKTDSLLAALDEIMAKAPKGKTIVFWDIDYVVFRSQTHFGSVEWAKEIYADIEKAGFTAEASENILNVIWRLIQPDTPIESCDENLHKVVESLDKYGIVQHGKTARPPEDAVYTLKQLQEVGFSVPEKPMHQNSAHHLKSDALGVCLPMCVVDRIAFVNSFTSKGIASDQLNLDEFDCVVIIEDSLSNITKVATAALSSGKQCIGIHYTGAMTKRIYNPEIARVQLQHYPERLTDEQARDKITKTTC